MTGNEQSQLRFDISEKVTLHHEQPGVDTLLSLDLTPEVHIEDLGANVKIQGVIRLSGTYLGQSDETPGQRAETSGLDEELAGEEIQYVIPVEITLPSERAGRLEDITAEIQSFDYELVSSHDLAVEAVLVIDGLQLANTGNRASASFGEQEEEQVLINEHEDLSETPEEPLDLKPQTFEPREYGRKNYEPLDFDFNKNEAEDEIPHKYDPLAYELNEPESEQPSAKEAEQTADADEKVSAEAGKKEAREESAQEENEALAQTEGDVEAETHPAVEEEKPETRIHFHKKEEKQTADPISLNDLLKKEESGDASVQSHDTDESSVSSPGDSYESSAAETETESGESEEEQTEAVQKTPGIEWMKQKLGGEEDRFHRLRMVIVQKEDTLEAIADRYDLSSVELLQVNKLETGELQEGQIVYIPERDS